MGCARWKVVRDAVLFFGGLIGVMHQEFGTTTERPTLLLLYAAMMAVPVGLRADERRRRNGNGNGAG